MSEEQRLAPLGKPQLPRRFPLWYAAIRWLVKAAFLRGFGGFRAVNLENIPETGAVIIAPIHLSHVDPPAVACGMRRQMRFMSKAELFDHWLFGPLIRSFGAYKINRGATDTESIRLTMDLLDAGEAVLIFPEGTRGDGQTMITLSRGVAMIAKRTKAPVVPVGIVGSNVRMGRGSSKIRRSKITVIYGEPFTYASVATSDSDKVNRVLFCNELAKRIASLCTDHGLPMKSGEPS